MPVNIQRIEGAIEELDAAICFARQEIAEKETAINVLCGLLGRPPRFPVAGGLPSIAHRLPLADRELPNGRLPEEEPPKKRRGRPPKVKAEPKAKIAERGKSERAKVFEAMERLKEFNVNELMAALPDLAEREGRGRKFFENSVTLAKSKGHIAKAGKDGKVVRYRWKPKPGHKAALMLLKVTPRIAPPAPHTPAAVPAEKPAQATGSARMSARDQLRAAVALLGETFTRQDLAQYWPTALVNDAAKQSFAVAITEARGAGEIAYASDRIPNGNEPVQYKRGPNWMLPHGHQKGTP